jgi:hypothetical protein
MKPNLSKMPPCEEMYYYKTACDIRESTQSFLDTCQYFSEIMFQQPHFQNNRNRWYYYSVVETVHQNLAQLKFPYQYNQNNAKISPLGNNEQRRTGRLHYL